MENKVDHNIEKWTAFCKNEEEAEKLLQEKVSLLSQRKLIVSAKKQLVESKTRPRDLFIYKFCIVTAPNNVDKLLS
jgi:hypothetical protein